ncbi:HlyD family secretion protein [Rhizobium sp. RHZ02]|uniref:HlyD family secretion protein n=1 Tax=Rhizobium sp. RHZ02 TaxID=2769306 RepID=UPI001786A9A6|nr:HlyD family secretion protein [Rhizobium sp. RHZ02]MBD9452562.1 HlyD family secretion protein [Rhizobium sp. RHZ02]
MTAESALEPSKGVEVPEPKKEPGNPLRRVALSVLLLAAFLFTLGVFMERRTPMSSQATVQAFVISIAPEVAGRVVEVGVIDNMRVSPKQMLFRIDPHQYQIAVSEAEAQLDSVGQSIGASTEAVNTAQAKLVEARASRDLSLEQANRAKLLVEQGVYPKSRYDQAKSGYDQAEAAVDAAEAELKRAEQELGPVGADNPQLRGALATLEKARLDLSRTTIEAPGEGVVTNLQLTAGGMVAVGQGALTFIDVDTVWITAAYKENSLENVTPGDRAEVLFDVLPGKLFPAKVESVGLGVAQGSIDPSTGLPKISTESGWIRTPQSFPVKLVLDEGLPRGVRYGSQANVVIYAGEHPITNWIGYCWMRLLSVLTYVS